MGWRVVVATLFALIVLLGALPSDESGPANFERLVLIIGLFVFLMLTLMAWAARGRLRSIIILTIASPLWLWFAYIMGVLFVWHDPDNTRRAYTIGIEIVLGLSAALITTIGIKFWRKRSITVGPPSNS